MILGSLVVAWLQTDQTTGIMGFVNRVLDLLRIGLFLGGLAWIAYNIINWRTAKYAVTNMRVLGHEGLVRARAIGHAAQHPFRRARQDPGGRQDARLRRLDDPDLVR